MSVILSPPPRIHYICSKKCGEIKMTKNAMHFQLICEFCTKVYTELAEFIKHLQLKQCQGFDPGNNGTNNQTANVCKMETDLDEREEIVMVNDGTVAVTSPLEFVSTTVKQEECPQTVHNDSDKKCNNTETDHLAAEETECHENITQFSTGIRLIYLISLLKEHTLLWNKQHPEYANQNARNAAHSRITNLLNKKFTDKNYTVAIIATRLDKLRELYRKMRYEKLSRLWYYENLKFLENTSCHTLEEITDTSIISSQEKNVYDDDNTVSHSSKEKTNKKPAEENKNKKSIANKEVTLALIELFKAERTLWDRTETDHLRFNVRRDHYRRFAEILNERFNLTLSGSDIYNIMTPLLDARRKNNTSAPYYKDMEFIPKYEQFPLKCEYCDETFRGHIALDKHEYVHTLTRKFQCDECDKSFITRKYYRNHKRTHLQNQFPCKECDKRFKTSQSRRIHSHREHDVPWPHTCEICKMGFVQLSYLNKHMRVHTGEKKYLCSICGKSYRQLNVLTSHMNHHTKNKKHPCTICNKSYYRSSNLKDHLKMHYNIRNHVCGTCGKKFTTKHILNQHEETHLKVRKH